MIKNSIMAIMSIAILLLLYKSCNDSNRVSNVKEFYKNVIDTMRVSRNKFGKSYQTSVISQKKMLLDLQSRDTAIIELQDAVKYYRKELSKAGSSVTVYETNTIIDTILSVETNTIVKNDLDTVEIKSISFHDDYVDVELSIEEDSARLSLQTKDKFIVTIGEEGFWKKKRFVEVTNSNPYSSLNYLKTYEVKQPKRKWFSIGIQAGYGIDLVDLKPKPYIGVGIQVNLINF